MGQGVPQQVKLSPPNQHGEFATIEIIPFECSLISECQVNNHLLVTALVSKQCLVTCYLNRHRK